ncbi:hypothetical protein [Terriglobus sp. TAA 43]|uniref:hypothetical protein n=1 Tax=Terriglobus sp. TAA 43 TaxID=278961 RepID=UPI0006486B48|nr:hypothetical protein [Terriglobus sp. TAA 43]
MKNKIAAALVTAISLVSVTLLFAQGPPVVNISSYRHGNLAAAQNYIVQAYQMVNQAQQANDGQLGGHAARAKQLLSQADYELRQAANVSNEEGH